MEVTGPPSGQQDTGSLWPSWEQPVLSVLGSHTRLRALDPELRIKEGNKEIPLEAFNIAHFVWPSKGRERWSRVVPVRRVQTNSGEPPNPACHQPFLKAQPHLCEPQFPPVQNKIHKPCSRWNADLGCL